MGSRYVWAEGPKLPHCRRLSLPPWPLVVGALSQKPTVVVQHAELVAQPYAAVKKLHADLVAAGVQRLTLPTEAQVSRLIRPSAHEAATYFHSERSVVGARAQKISAALSQVKPELDVPAASWHVAPRRAKEAIVTLLTTDNVDYLRGALVLGSSIRSFDSMRDMVRELSPPSSLPRGGADFGLLTRRPHRAAQSYTDLRCTPTKSPRAAPFPPLVAWPFFPFSPIVPFLASPPLPASPS